MSSELPPSVTLRPSKLLVESACGFPGALGELRDIGHHALPVAVDVPGLGRVGRGHELLVQAVQRGVVQARGLFLRIPSAAGSLVLTPAACSQHTAKFNGLQAASCCPQDAKGWRNRTMLAHGPRCSRRWATPGRT